MRARRQGLIPFLLLVFLGGAAVYDLPPLVDAAKKNDGAALRALVEQGADVNAPDADGATALHWVSYWDDLEGVSLLIRAGADVNVANDLGATPLWSAAINRSSAIVSLLLEAGANPNAPLLSGETPLMAASRSGNPDVVKQLLDSGADPNVSATRGQTALMWASGEDHVDIVDLLIEHGADITARSDVWTNVEAVPPHSFPENNFAIPHGGNSAFLFAVRAGKMEAAKHLLAAGADVNDKDAWGVSATVLAAHSGDAELLEYLLQQGADPNAADAGFSALHAAVSRRDARLVGTLLEHGADPHAPLRTWTPTRRASMDYHFQPALIGASPLWLAARFLAPDVMRLLIDHGADPLFVHDAEFFGGGGFGGQARTERTTTLMAALEMADGGPYLPAPQDQHESLILEAVQLLLSRGVDVNAVDTEGRTALDGATGLGYQTVVELLREKGATSGKEAPL